MILGTGIDIIEVNRIAQAIERWGTHFLEHVFCPEEITYAQKFKKSEQRFAGRFAAKEAVIKALGGAGTLHWTDIKVINDDDGRPVCQLQKADFSNHIQLSISHTHIYAVACAIIT